MLGERWLKSLVQHPIVVPCADIEASQCSVPHFILFNVHMYLGGINCLITHSASDHRGQITSKLFLLPGGIIVPTAFKNLLKPERILVI